MKFIITSALTLMWGISFAQDTANVMFYNLLNYPNINSGRITHLETILQYQLPDILAVNELNSETGANNILNFALNTNGVTNYSRAAYVQGPDTQNMLFYNNDKFGLVSQNEIATSLRDINEYVLYYKEGGLNASSDTVYLYVYSLHLKAGNQASNASDRAAEVNTFKNYLSNLTNAENIIAGGDMNIYSSTEQAYTNFLSAGSVALVDPLNLTGNYNNNSAFADHHTQSTRTTSIDNGAGGGMDDRFDMIFHSTDVSNSTNSVSVVPGSNIPLGQDGLHFNDDLIDIPANTVVPPNVTSALYYMSDHLPVMIDLAMDVTLNLEIIRKESFKAYYANGRININFRQNFSGNISIYNLTGRQIVFENVNSISSFKSKVDGLASGLYIIHCSNNSGYVRKKIYLP